jgi:hypothetical protein
MNNEDIEARLKELEKDVRVIQCGLSLVGLAIMLGSYFVIVSYLQ